jgi:hypothetical protein
MATASEIRAKIADFLSGEIPLEAFEDWFALKTWNVHQWGDSALVSLVHQVELRLSEHSAGHLESEQLREQLRQFVQQYQAPLLAAPPVAVASSASSLNISFPGEVRFGFAPGAGRRLSWECA